MDQYKYHQITKQADRLSRYAVHPVTQTPEYKALVNEAVSARVELQRRQDLLVLAQRSARLVTWDDRSLPQYEGDDLAFLKAMARDCWKHVRIAEKRVAESQAECSRIHQEQCRLWAEHGEKRDKSLDQGPFLDRERTNENQ